MTNLSRVVTAGLSLLAACAALGIGEVMVRLSGRSPAVIRLAPKMAESAYRLSDDPVLGYDLKPEFRSANPDCHHSFPFVNKWGLRDRERMVEKRTGTNRVLLLGDSVVAGHGVCDLEHLISAQLERRLGRDTWEVLNFGIGGYCTRAEVRLLQSRGIQFKPDVVVLLFVFNDFIDRNSDLLTHLERPRAASLNTLFLRSQLFRLAALRFNWFGFANEFGETNRHESAVGKDNVAQGLGEFAALSRSAGFRPIVAMWPYFDDKEIFEPTRIVESKWSIQETEVERVAREHQLPTFRLSPAFRHDFFERKNRAKTRQFVTPRWSYTTGDGSHPSQIGSEIAAEALATELRRVEK